MLYVLGRDSRMRCKEPQPGGLAISDRAVMRFEDGPTMISGIGSYLANRNS